MPYRYYGSIEEYRRECFFWGQLNRILNRDFNPNPWIFESCYWLQPDEHRYEVNFKNFDGTKRLIASVTPGDKELTYSLRQIPE